MRRQSKAWRMDSTTATIESGCLRGGALGARVQATIESVVREPAEILGGIAFMGSTDVAYLLCARRERCVSPAGTAAGDEGG